MGQVSNAAPTLLTDVKSALGSGFSKLTDFYNTGPAGVVNTAGATGFIPSSGTINLSSFRDATRANVRGNIYINVDARDDGGGSASALARVYFLPNGSLRLHGHSDGATGNGVTGNISGSDGSNVISTLNREWLLLNTNPCIHDTANNFEIRVIKIGGTDIAPSPNNTWTNAPINVQCFISFSGIGGEPRDLTCNVQIRRLDTQAILHTGIIRLMTRATVFGGG